MSETALSYATPPSSHIILTIPIICLWSGRFSLLNFSNVDGISDTCVPIILRWLFNASNMGTARDQGPQSSQKHFILFHLVYISCAYLPLLNKAVTYITCSTVVLQYGVIGYFCICIAENWLKIYEIVVQFQRFPTIQEIWHSKLKFWVKFYTGNSLMAVSKSGQNCLKHGQIG